MVILISVLSLQLLEQNDDLNEKVKELTTQYNEQEARADDFEREVKSLNAKLTAKEGIMNIVQMLHVQWNLINLTVTQLPSHWVESNPGNTLVHTSYQRKFYRAVPLYNTSTIQVTHSETCIQWRVFVQREYWLW